MFDLEEIIDLAIQIEENGRKAYLDAARGSKSIELANIFNSLAEQEVRHIRIFESMRPTVPGLKGPKELAQSGKALLRKILGNQTFSMADVDLSQITRVDELLKTAVEFEKDTILFYQMLREVVSEETTRTGLDHIIEEENRHVDILEDLRSSR